MDNIVGYICSTPWGTVSRTTPSLGWTPVLPAIPDGWQDAGTGAAPTGFRIIVRPGLTWEALADYCLEHSDELDELAHTGTAWAGYPSDWAAASDELMDELLGVLL